MNIKKKFFREVKKIIFDPINFIPDLISDFNKDREAYKLNLEYNLVWCCGMPKSGSSLIEDLFEKLPYVRVDSSSLRYFNNDSLDHPHGISDQMFEAIPKKKLSFLKTHTHFNPQYIRIANKYNARIIVSLRDLRDVMISRYYHILNEKIHWQHKYIKGLSFEEGFIKSLDFYDNTQTDKPIIINYNWIKNWLNKIESKQYLFLWYEDYIENPKNYISKILKFINFENSSPDLILEQIKNQNKYNLSLKKNYSKYGKRKSTFRSGKNGAWKELFTDKISDYFYSNIPGPIEDIIKKN